MVHVSAPEKEDGQDQGAEVVDLGLQGDNWFLGALYLPLRP